MDKRQSKKGKVTDKVMGSLALRMRNAVRGVVGLVPTMIFGNHAGLWNIISAVEEETVSAVSLSVVFPPDDLLLPRELRRLRRGIGERVPLLIGGGAAHAYAADIRRDHAILMEDLRTLSEALATQRAAYR